MRSKAIAVAQRVQDAMLGRQQVVGRIKPMYMVFKSSTGKPKRLMLST